MFQQSWRGLPGPGFVGETSGRWPPDRSAAPLDPVALHTYSDTLLALSWRQGL